MKLPLAVGLLLLTQVGRTESSSTDLPLPQTASVHAEINVPPTVILRLPQDGAVLYPPAEVTLEADAWDSDGAVVQVNFYQNHQVIGSRSFIPHRLALDPLDEGVYVFQAEATDNDGASTLSAPITVYVEPPPVSLPPGIRIVNPASESVLTAPLDLDLEVDVSDADGFVQRVTYRVGDTWLADVNTSPFSLRWDSVAVGTYTITATAYDDRNLSTESDPVQFTVLAADHINPPWFQLIDLGTLGGSFSAATALNNAGQITGSAADTNNQTQAFLWEAGAMKALGGLEGATFGTSINDLGVIVGDAVFGGGGETEAFRWSESEGLSLLESLGGSQTRARDINDNGQIVGWSTTTEDNRTYPVLWQEYEPIRILDDIPGTADAINQLGHIAGTHEIVEWQTNRAFLWKPGQFTSIDSLGGDSSGALAINDADQVVGRAQRPDVRWHAFLWESGQLTGLGTLGGRESTAFAINESGQIVGESLAPNGWGLAFLRHQGVMFDLNTLMPPQTNGTLIAAKDINNQGMIVGTALYRDGEAQSYRAFLLVPYPEGWPRFVTTPAARTVLEGGNAVFSVVVEGAEPFEFQWQRNGVNLEDGSGIHGATTSTLSIDPASPSHAGSYSITINNSVGAATSPPAALRVVRSDEPPGTELWVAPTGGAVTGSPAIATDGTIYIGSHDHQLYAFRVPGELKWTFRTRGQIRSSPVIGRDGTIYFGAEHPDNHIYAVDPNGDLDWTYAAAPGETSVALADDGTIYLHTAGQLHALEPNGQLRWIHETAGTSWISTPSIGVDGTIYIGTTRETPDGLGSAGFLQAIDPEGHLLWEFSDRGPFVSAAAIGPDGTIYFGSLDNDGKIFALDPEGNKKWEFATGSAILNAPALGPDGTIYIAVQERLDALSPSGTRKWSFATGAQIRCTPAIGEDGLIYFGSLDGRLYALHRNGVLAWSYLIEWNSNGESSPALGNDAVVYFGAVASLYAVQASSRLATNGWPMFQANLQHTGRAPSGSTPRVLLTQPATDMTIRPIEDMVLRAHAYGGEGGIAQVTFFADETELGTAFQRPYQFVWVNPPSGNYQLTARATDHAGETIVSPPVGLTINEPPSVRWQSPPDQSELFAGELQVLRAIAFDLDGAVDRVDFFLDEALMGSITQGPFVFRWANPEVGTWRLSARATDNLGGIAWSEPVEVQVRPRFFVRLVGVEAGATLLAPATFGLTVEVVHLDNPLETVGLYLDQIKTAEWTEPPFQAHWSNLSVGQYRFTATARDVQGNVQTSIPLDIQVLDPDGQFQTEWITAGGDWPDPVHWSIRTPLARDTAWINNHGVAEVKQGQAEARRLVVARDATGSLLHYGGSLTVFDEFILGEQEGALGRYELSGSGRLTVGEALFVGLAGTGLVVQTDGQLETDLLGLSGDLSGHGAYHLRGGQLTARFQYLVAFDTGEFIQTGGTNNVTEALMLGTGRDTTARYELAGGLMVSPLVVIGDRSSAFATFSQSGGEQRVQELRIGNAGHGVLELTGGILLAEDLELGPTDWGELKIHSPVANIHISSRLVFGPYSGLEAVPGTKVHFSGSHIDVQTQNREALAGTTNLNLVIASGDTPARLEIASQPAFGYDANFSLSTLTLGGDAPGWVTLENLRANHPNAFEQEALLTRNLELHANGQLDLDGHGMFVRNHASNIAGAIYLNSGVLSFENGAVLGPTARLADGGTVLGDLTNHGRIALNHETLFLAGAFAQGPTGHLELALGAPADPLFRISGTAQLEGTLRIELPPDELPVLGQTWPLLTANQLELRLDAVALPLPRNGLAWQLRVEPGALWLETVQQPDLESIGLMRMNPQTGLFEQTVELRNPGTVTLHGIRLLIGNLPPGARVHNALRIEDDLYLVQFPHPLEPGATIDLVLEWYFPNRQPSAEVTIMPDVAYPFEPVPPDEPPIEINRSLQLSDGSYLVEFSSQPGATYWIQYSDDLVSWLTAAPTVTGTGSTIQWIDAGPPKTQSHPANAARRFYRLIRIEPASTPPTP